VVVAALLSWHEHHRAARAAPAPGGCSGSGRRGRGADFAVRRSLT
jgi:hypothetical protein